MLADGNKTSLAEGDDASREFFAGSLLEEEQHAEWLETDLFDRARRRGELPRPTDTRLTGAGSRSFLAWQPFPVMKGDAACASRTDYADLVVDPIDDPLRVLHLLEGDLTEALRQPPVPQFLDRPAQGAHPVRVTDLGEVEDRLLEFERRYELTAEPFEWRFTRKDLARLMRRLREKEEGLPAAA